MRSLHGCIYADLLVVQTRADGVLTRGASKTGTLQEPQWRGEMAKQYSFTLDPFQSTAIACLVRSKLPRPPNVSMRNRR